MADEAHTVDLSSAEVRLVLKMLAARTESDAADDPVAAALQLKLPRPAVDQCLTVLVRVFLAAADPVHVDSAVAHVAPAMNRVVGEFLADQIDRDPDAPMPFAFKGAEVVWGTASLRPRSALDARIAEVRGAKEDAVWAGEFDRAAELRKEDLWLQAVRELRDHFLTAELDMLSRALGTLRRLPLTPDELRLVSHLQRRFGFVE